jgi:hypothetical protein
MEILSILLKKGQEEGNLTGVKVSRVITILHLIFFYDVLIMTKETVEEWMVIKTTLEQFCSASGLKVNLNKYTFHHVGLQGEYLARFKDIFPYNFMELSGGFRYLGYFIKAEKNSFEDWRWLIIKFEKRIKHWCNCWLTLGGRCTLAKVVLKTQSVFWMALTAVPISVLTKIRKLIFDFLWTGNRK